MRVRKNSTPTARTTRARTTRPTILASFFMGTPANRCDQETLMVVSSGYHPAATPCARIDFRFHRSCSPMAWIIIGLLTGLLVLLTLLPLSRHTAWWVRVWDFPRLQLATLAALLIVAALALLDLAHPASWALLGAAATCLAWQAWWILP